MAEGRSQPVTHRLMQLARERAGRPALTIVAPDGGEVVVGWDGLADGMVAAAQGLHDRGVRRGDLVAVSLPKSAEHFFAVFGAWHLGARPLVLNPAMPVGERARLLEVAEPVLVVTGDEWTGGRADVLAGSSLPPCPPEASFAIATGGSSGLPKVILSPFPGSFEDLDHLPDEEVTGRCKDMVQLVNGPLYHNSPFTLAFGGLLWGHHLVVMQRLDASQALELIERHRVSFVPTVPTVMRRLLEAYTPGRRLDSIEALFHTGSSCPPSVKEAWIDLLGADRVFEAFGGSELIGATFIRGDEWLVHRGSVGRPFGADVAVLGPTGEPVAPGEVGEIFMRSHRSGPGYEYLGATSTRRSDGYESLGDLGWLDEGGYLYVADRRVDLIITGGENVYPAEVENVILSHPGVADAVVIGVPDAAWGKKVHAVICRRDPMLTPADVIRLCRDQLSAYKVPKSIEFVTALPRDPESGKIRRSSLVEQGAPGTGR